MIVNIRHAAIVVNDLEKMTDFYQSFLGFKKLSEEIESGPFIEKLVGLPQAKLHWVKLQTPSGILVELIKYLHPISEFKGSLQKSNQLGHSHLAMTVENMDQFIQNFVARSGELINPAEVNPSKTAKVCYIHDPEGNLLEMVEVL